MAQTSAAPGITAEQLKEARQAARDRQRIKEGGAVLRSVATGTVVSGVVLTGTAETSPPAPSRAQSAGAMVMRVGRGVRTAPEAFRAWRLATEFDARIVAFEQAGDQKAATAALLAQLTEGKARRERAAKVARPVAILAPAVLFGGWPWATVVALLAICGAFVLLQFKAMHGKVVSWLAGVFGVSTLLTALSWFILGVRPSGGLLWSPGYLIVPTLVLTPAVLYAVVWAIKATKDDGTITDQLPRGPVADMAPATATLPTDGPMTDGAFERAVNESVPKLDPSDPAKCARVLVPGIIPAPHGGSYSVVVDTRGIVPAEALAAPAIRTALASKLRVGAGYVFPVAHEDNAALATITVLEKDGFGAPVTSALVTAESVDLWSPPPFMRVLTTGADVPLNVAGVSGIGIGGMPDYGKSTTLSALILMYLIAGAKVKVIDGGEVDTKPFHEAGLLTAWCRDPKDAVNLLTESIAEIDETQAQLTKMGKRKVDPEFFAATGTDFELLAWDELEAYTNHPDATIRNDIRRLSNDYISRCRKTGRMLAWATQSPSAEGLDSNFRDKTLLRIAHYCSTPQMSDKILGSRKASRGVDASTLPGDVPGAAWYLGRTGAALARPHRITETQVDQVIARLQRERRAGRFTAAPDGAQGTILAVAALIRADGTTVSDGRRVMRSKDVADRLGMDQMQLASALGPEGIRTQKIRRPDDPDSDNRMHYVLADFPASRVG